MRRLIFLCHAQYSFLFFVTHRAVCVRALISFLDLFLRVATVVINDGAVVDTQQVGHRKGFSLRNNDDQFLLSSSRVLQLF